MRKFSSRLCVAILLLIVFVLLSSCSSNSAEDYRTYYDRFISAIDASGIQKWPSYESPVAKDMKDERNGPLKIIPTENGTMLTYHYLDGKIERIQLDIFHDDLKKSDQIPEIIAAFVWQIVEDGTDVDSVRKIALNLSADIQRLDVGTALCTAVHNDTISSLYALFE